MENSQGTSEELVAPGNVLDPSWRTHSCVPRRHSCRRPATLQALQQPGQPRILNKDGLVAFRSSGNATDLNANLIAQKPEVIARSSWKIALAREAALLGL